jgi:SAM-dependent methyltransferase
MPSSAGSGVAISKVISEQCEQCSGSEYVTVLRNVRDPITLQPFEIEACRDCGLARTAPQPAQIESYYGPRYYGRRHWITTAYCLWRRIRVVNLTFGRVREHSVLDVGCGEGAFLERARRRGWAVTGTEIDVGRLSLAGIRIASSLAELHERYDCITCWHVLEHLPDPLASLRVMRNRLTEDGALVLSVPDAGGLQARIFGRFWFHRDVPRHLFHFDLQSLRRTLEKAGFQVVKVWHHELEYDLFGWIQSALNSILKTPNVLFDALTGHPRRTGYGPILFSVLFAAVMFPLAFALTVVTTLVRQGGTLIVSCRPTGMASNGSWS